MCKEKENTITKKSLVFMNTPITTETDDVIGFSTQVEKLDSAIESGGQMLAITSPFGAGKTSVVELLQDKYKDSLHKQIIKIPMWTHLSGNNQPDGSTTELHKGFVYQTISQINWRRGIYVSRLLNPNFGLLKAQTGRLCYWICTFIALILFLFGYVLPEKFEFSLPFLGEAASSYEWLMIFVAAVLLVFVVTKSEIVFSSNKSEGGRKVDTSEIMQLYRTEVLQYKRKWHKRNKKGRHYIVVIEDLDRTDDSEAVVNFLKELRKYYVPECTSGQSYSYLNKVTFLINVKPETQLYPNKQNQTNDVKDMEDSGHLYAKLFDYVLNLQTINIDDYETILEGLLSQKKEDIRLLGLESTGKMVEIPGMQWITRGTHIGIREIKDRLNIAFSLFESLKNRFKETIEFEKCAISAYITTEFEKAFYDTDDQAFQKIVNLYLTESLNDEEISKILPSVDLNYKKAIKELVESKLIDSNYRIYFYNYPKDSKVLSTEEANVQQAILYGESLEGLDKSIASVLTCGSAVIEKSLITRKKLGLNLPDVVFKFEQLYVQSLQHVFPEVLTWLKKLDYSPNASEKTIEQYKMLLLFDASRTAYSKEHASEFVKVWEEKFSESALLQLRKMLCKEFSSEISWYLPLFYGVHKLISFEELGSLSIHDAIHAVNTESDDLSPEIVQHLEYHFEQEEDVSSLSKDMHEFLSAAAEKMDDTLVIECLLRYQIKIEEIIPTFEITVFNAITDTSREDSSSLMYHYKLLINIIAEEGALTEQTLANIASLDQYHGFSSAVSEQMKSGGYPIEYILQTLSRGDRVPFENDEILQALKKNLQWLVKNNHVLAVRKAIMRESLEVFLQYDFMFGDTCPLMTADELQSLWNTPIKIKDFLSLLPPALFTEDDIDIFSPYLCREKQGSTESYDILMFVSQMNSSVSEKMFYALDFDKIRYRHMSADRRSNIKLAFNDCLSLDTVLGKLEFMEATRFLDSNWENQIWDDLKEDEDLQRKYVAAVKSAAPGKAITKTTVQILCSFSTAYIVPEHVYQAYYDLGHLEKYVSCKTNGQKCFELESGERGDTLWPVYLKILKSNNYVNTKRYMGQNKHFLEKLMQEKAFTGMAQDSLLLLTTILQTKECIEHILTLESEFALKYLTQILGFSDRPAAVAFVEGVEKNDALLCSDALYAHTHERLIDGPLKGKYTRARTKKGYGREE